MIYYSLAWSIREETPPELVDPLIVVLAVFPSLPELKKFPALLIIIPVTSLI